MFRFLIILEVWKGATTQLLATASRDEGRSFDNSRQQGFEHVNMINTYSKNRIGKTISVQLIL